MKNTMTDLHNHLFATLEALQDDANPMEIDRARTIADVAKVVVQAAQAEVEFLKVTGGGGSHSGFFPPTPTPTRTAPAIAAARPLLLPEITPLRICSSCLRKTRADPCEHCKTAWRAAS